MMSDYRVSLQHADGAPLSDAELQAFRIAVNRVYGQMLGQERRDDAQASTVTPRKTA